MIEEYNMLGLGLAYVDGKINSSKLHLPSNRNQLPAFLDAHPEAHLSPGGSIPNILTAFVRLSGNPNIKLLSCVGGDARGKFYIEHTDRRLGEPQVSARNPTGIWVGIYDNGLVEDMDFCGTAIDLTVSNEDLPASKNAVFITDIDACTIPQTADQVKRTLSTVDDGLFVLSLSGADPNENTHQILSFTDREPDVVFGNASELLCITRQKDVNKAIKILFPSTRLMVITQAEKETVIRFEKDTLFIPVKDIPKENVIDGTGAGDLYMGTMLALLLHNRYTHWNEYEILRTARVASYASTLVIQSMHSQLTLEMAQLILDYARS